MTTAKENIREYHRTRQEHVVGGGCNVIIINDNVVNCSNKSIEIYLLETVSFVLVTSTQRCRRRCCLTGLCGLELVCPCDPVLFVFDLHNCTLSFNVSLPLLLFSSFKPLFSCVLFSSVQIYKFN